MALGALSHEYRGLWSGQRFGKEVALFQKTLPSAHLELFLPPPGGALLGDRNGLAFYLGANWDIKRKCVPRRGEKGGVANTDSFWEKEEWPTLLGKRMWVQRSRN